MSTVTEKKIESTPLRPRTEFREQSYLNAQLEVFLYLGSQSELSPGEEFSAILNLANAIISGELSQVQDALVWYKSRSSLLFEHSRHLRKMFANKGVLIQEPTILKYSDPLGRPLCIVVLPVNLEKAGKIVFVSSDKSMTSYVHEIREFYGIITMEPIQEDPKLLLKHASKLIRIPELGSSPPPFAHQMV